MNMQLVLLLLLWRSLLGASESTITHASNVSKRQLQFGGGGNFPPPNYQAHGNQQANHFMQTPTPLLYDPGYNAQHLHEVDTVATDNNATDAAELGAPPNATQPLQQSTQTNVGLDAPQFGAPQTFSHIYFPHASSPQHALSRTAAHVFPGETPAALAARNSGRTYSTSSTYFLPLSVLYHPNAADAQQPHGVYTQRLAQQQQQMPVYPPLPPSTAALYQQFAPPAVLPPTQSTAASTIAAPSIQSAQQPAQTTMAQQQTALMQNGYTPSPALAALPRLPHLLPLSPSPAHTSSPLPLNFQAPFHPSQFLGYMQERDTRNAMASATVSAVARTPQHTQAYAGYTQQQQPKQQQQVEKPIYEHMAGGVAKPQNYQAAVTQQAHYNRYIYMAPQNGYALFKAA